jgi:hypothetical protein
MDNYFQQCPAMMSDGRLFTDYRSSQIREQQFRYENDVESENEARTYRIVNAEDIMDSEWDIMRNKKSCFSRQNCFHDQSTTRVSNVYNNAELLAYNGVIPAPRCNKNCCDFRLTYTKGSKHPNSGCTMSSQQSNRSEEGYPTDRYPARYPKTNTIIPENLYNDY